jgi:hypothetical protein
MPSTCSTLRTHDFLSEVGDLYIVGELRHINRPLVTAGSIEACGDEPVDPEVAHVAKGHRWTGGALRSHAFGVYDVFRDCPRRRHIKAGWYVSTC